MRKKFVTALTVFGLALGLTAGNIATAPPADASAACTRHVDWLARGVRITNVRNSCRQVRGLYVRARLTNGAILSTPAAPWTTGASTLAIPGSNPITMIIRQAQAQTPANTIVTYTRNGQ